MPQNIGVDIDNDGKPDLNLDLKTIIVVIGGIISLTMSYSALTKKIEDNRIQIEEAKKLPPQESHELIEQKLLYLENMIKDVEDKVDKIEDKVYKR
mgnify:CR=1 FL=1|jgi:hypothetical protein|tara:strand:+ start:1659 stop:1946 length:288 start_codon:yes stop_codon:yes gene_type:complete